MAYHPKSDRLDAPLDEALGAIAQVRLLRLFCVETVGPVSTTRAATAAGLTSAGARRALTRLNELGFVRKSGGPRSTQYELRREEPLAAPLVALFEAERRRRDDLLDALRSLVRETTEITTAWLDRPDDDSAGEMTLHVVTSARARGSVRDALRHPLMSLERTHGFLIHLAVHTAADAPQLPENVEWLVLDHPVGERLPSLRDQGPESREIRALRVGRFIADRVGVDPTLVARAIRHVDRLLREDHGTSMDALVEWRALLTSYPARQLQNLLVSRSPRAERLRRSSPFLAVLSTEEHDDLIAFLEEES